MSRLTHSEPEKQFKCLVIGNEPFRYVESIPAGGIADNYRERHKVVVIFTANIVSQEDPRYTVVAAAKSADGIGVPLVNRAHNRASGFFMREALPHLFVVSMVGRVGEPQGSPGSLLTGYANPARLTTLEIGVSGGELPKLNREAATMATTPIQTHPETSVINHHPYPRLTYRNGYRINGHKASLADIYRAVTVSRLISLQRQKKAFEWLLLFGGRV